MIQNRSCKSHAFTHFLWYRFNAANQHAAGIAKALAAGPPTPEQLPPYGGRIWLTEKAYTIVGGIGAADKFCADEVSGAVLSSVKPERYGNCYGEIGK